MAYWPSYSLKIKKNNLKNQRAHSVSIDFNHPPTYLQSTEILIPLFHLKLLAMKVTIRRCPSYTVHYLSLAFQWNKIKIICAKFKRSWHSIEKLTTKELSHKVSVIRASQEKQEKESKQEKQKVNYDISSGSLTTLTYFRFLVLSISQAPP